MIKIKEIREAKAFNEYRDYLLGKYNLTYFHTEDKIINVTLGESIEYTVLDVKTGEVRKHSTKINKNEVYIKEG